MMITKIEPNGMNGTLFMLIIKSMRTFICFHLSLCILLFILLRLYWDVELANILFVLYSQIILSTVIHEFGHLVPYLLFTRGKKIFFMKSHLLGLSVLTLKTTRLQNLMIAVSGPGICVVIGMFVIQYHFLAGMIYMSHVIFFFPSFSDGENILLQIMRSE